MVNSGIEIKSRESLITEIRRIQNELVFLKVKRELLDLGRMDLSELSGLVDALRDQLRQRKKFLGVK